MKYGYITFILTSLILFSGPVKSEQGREQELERQIQLRDGTILELLERVEALEQRTGVQRPKKENSRDDITSSDNNKIAAPGAVAVTAADAERALERSLTVEGALLLPAGVLEIEPGYTYTRQEQATPGLVTMGPQVFASESELNANIFTASLDLRYGLPWGAQLELGIPYRRSRLESVTTIDFVPTSTAKQTTHSKGDLRIGVAKTLLREGVSHPDLVGRITWDSDSGDEESFDEVQVSMTAIKRQDPMTFIGGLSYQQARGKDQVEPGSLTSLSFGSLVALSPETSMRFQVSGAYQKETRQAGQAIAASDRTFASFVIGGSSLIARGVLLNLSLGIGLTEDADELSLLVSLPVRF